MALLDTHIYRPAPPLSAYVDCMWYRRGLIANRRREYSMPTGCVDLVINLHTDRIRVFETPSDRVGICANGAIVHGAQSRSFILDNVEHVHFVGVHFRPGGACLLGLPLHHLADRHVSLDELWGATARELRERLMQSASNVPQLFGILERELVRRRDASRRVHPAISLALRSLHRGQSIASVRKDTGYCERRFTNLFAQAVGLTPKKFARVQRLGAALQQLAMQTSPIADIAAALGYYDQAHLHHEVRELAGIAPSQYEPMQRSPLHMEVR